MSEKIKYYWPVESETKEVLNHVEAEYRGGMYHIPRDALQSKPLPSKQGFAVIAVLDESGKPIGSEYIEDHRGMTIYDESDCTKSEVVSKLGAVIEGFTPDKPLTVFDERINGKWVTNISNQYIAKYAMVDTTRESLYRERTDPLENKAARLARNGATAEELQVYYDRIDELVAKIKADNPWPEPPEA